MSGPDSPRRVALLGRTNVGKSTLFNALIGRRRAITHSTPGVTRDPVEAECAFGPVRILLSDTGGYRVERDAMDEEVAQRSLKAARESDLALLLIDALEITPEDESLMERLRPLADRVVLVVNKVDTPSRDTLVWNTYAYGFAHVVGVSAAHHRNLDELRDLVASLLESAPAGARAPTDAGTDAGTAAEGDGSDLESDEAPLRIAILGKPNTGKSSLANRLLGEERSIVSDVPGTTRDVVEGSFSYRRKRFEVLDTAGIRRRSRVRESIEYYSVGRATESIRRADVVLLLVDAVEGLADQDKKIASLAVKEGRGILLVLNKWDLLAAKPRLLKDSSERIRFLFPVLGFAPIVPVSALTGFGVKRLLDTALEVGEQLRRRVGTGRLNQVLEQWVSHYPLPVRGKNYKIRFATQVGVNPVRFVVFVNRIAGFPAAYSQYLQNCIRRELGFGQVPVAVEFRASRKTAR
ncbi:MAG: ribosome biogenesis GTPase Der [Spirochaetes bacterium]|nr:ribosome biogenesis GTPase Der [Spirochaetota bacterium]